MPLNRLHISCLALVLALSSASGQVMPPLGVSKEINTGSFANGLRYYLVNNDSEKGFADFALVRKAAPQETDRLLLDSLPHFGSRTPYRFLADNGIGYAREGYLSVRSGAGIISLAKVPVYNQEAADSTMLLLMDIAASSRAPQAVIVSGDIDVAKVRDRLDLLSMMVPKLRPAPAVENYEWTRSDSLRIAVTSNSTEEVAAITAIYRARRMPSAMMNTLQPLVSAAYAEMLGQIISRRLENSFRSRGIPLAHVSFDYKDSSEGPGDEYYSLSLFTSASSLADATAVLASVLSSLDKNGATAAELEENKSRMKTAPARLPGTGRMSNGEYVEKCTASYLYGSNLASGTSVKSFLTGRDLPLDRELLLFNGFVSALLDSARNLSLRYDVPYGGVDRRLMRDTFFSSWADGGDEAAAEDFSADTSGVYSFSAARTRLRADTAEPISGGRMWTFANGIRTVYKKMDTPGEFRYSLMLRGGIASVPGLAEGEGAFVEDMLPLSNIAGMKGREFLSMLEAEGITMDFEAGLSDLRISGTAPKNRLSLLLRSLLALSRDRTPDREEFEYYKAAEALRIDMGALSPRNVNSLMDSIMRPNYYFTGRKRMECLQDDLPERAEQYFFTEFSKINDGLLVLAGDLDEAELKKELSRTLGGFNCLKKYSQRPKVSSRFASGSVTYMVEALPGLVGGGEIGVNVGMSADISYSIGSYIAFKAAAACIRKELVGVLADCGAYVELSDRLEIFPDERMWLYINCHPCRSTGLPASVSPGSPLEMLDAVRKVTSRLEQIEISDADLRAYKEQVRSEFGRMSSDPDATVDAVLLRYSDGKDVVTGFKRAVDELTADDIKGILSDLQHGAEVEYVII